MSSEYEIATNSQPYAEDLGVDTINNESAKADGQPVSVTRNVNPMADLRLCFDEIVKKRTWAIDQRKHFNNRDPEDPDDHYAYEYYDGMVDAYARAMSIIEKHMKEQMLQHEGTMPSFGPSD
jgi:hypothetical protein